MATMKEVHVNCRTGKSSIKTVTDTRPPAEPLPDPVSDAKSAYALESTATGKINFIAKHLRLL